MNAIEQQVKLYAKQLKFTGFSNYEFGCYVDVMHICSGSRERGASPCSWRCRDRVGISSQSGGVLTKSADHSTEDTYTIRDFNINYENVESGLHFITTFQLEVPLKLGADILPPIKILMNVDSACEAKF